MNIKLTSFPLFLLFTFIFPSVCLSINNGNLNYESTENIYGFQFNHNDCVTLLEGTDWEGDAVSNGFSISAGTETILGFSFSGDYIPPGGGVLINNVSCETISDISEVTMAGQAINGIAPPLEIELSDDCNLNIIDNYSPASFSINDIYPNPFNPICNVNYSISSYGHVTISLFNIQGRKLLTPINQVMAPGNYNITIDGNELTSGLYFISIIHDGNELKRKISLVK